MLQAILITAYKDLQHLRKIIDFFDDDFEIYIHFDRKVNIRNANLKKTLNAKNVKLISRKYQVNWGGFNHLKAIMHLLEEALKNSKIGYFHLISGQDYPMKKIDSFKIFFLNNRGTSFLDYQHISLTGWKNNGLDRYEFFNFYDYLDYKNLYQRKILYRLFQLQRKYGIRRKLPFEMSNIYAGSTWWSLNREAAEFVIGFTSSKPKIFKRFRYTLCSEEIYFQTVLCNFFDSNLLVQNNLRHIDWNARNNSNPAVLDITDYDKLVTSEAFFARKFDGSVSSDLLKDLDDFIRKRD
ncbi:beta-1,6-N-acetylglucosaminyltransferase [Leeuwenhoekiella polynyae]|uniref:Peptide O-xylosyltransferase n=1 Tax=Leeuwenhoekiella polynyae TaxID=1550906 RepID=A0A4Q0PEH9_9FLAO|nr:beta-1,6-N-acetylglucosaminyltransferase [Leeuwenhoekiella polynyae]RXG25181.1 core-2/I-Branching enzyme [Leeuwenhoekiella polynyae]